MLTIYRAITAYSGPILKKTLQKRGQQGKEDLDRLAERCGQPSQARPAGPLVWIHAASVGESQSALIMVDRITKSLPDAPILVTTGTLTSAALMAQRLPQNAIHQFVPLDHPNWVKTFLDHWQPDLALWMESELWPNMLSALKDRNIPAYLINARLSEKSYKRWKLFKSSAEQLLSGFTAILAQTETDKAWFNDLGASNVIVTDNLKYSAARLPYDGAALANLKSAIGNRPMWLYASTHEGEESLACDTHKVLQQDFPNLLTIIVPRHPQRRDGIAALCMEKKLQTALRGKNHNTPDPTTQIYIADTLGELGLFYKLSPIACIGRSFSDDGGGGHNPIEAAQFGCAVIYGPHVQFQQQIYDSMKHAGAAIKLSTPANLRTQLKKLLSSPDYASRLQESGKYFAQGKATVIETVMDHLQPALDKLAEKDLAQCA